MLNAMERRRHMTGITCALLSYGCWGLVPIYFKSLRHVSAAEVLMHRCVWSFLILSIVITLLKRWREIVSALAKPRIMLALLTSSILIAANWVIYIWAVNHGQLTQASLGYFINPLGCCSAGCDHPARTADEDSMDRDLAGGVRCRQHDLA